MSPRATACHCVSPRVTACHRMSPHATACHRVPPHVTACHRVSPNKQNSFLPLQIVQSRNVNITVSNCIYIVTFIYGQSDWLSKLTNLCIFRFSLVYVFYHTTACHRMSPRLPPHVTACHRMPPRVTAVSPRATTCHRVSLRATACHRVPPNKQNSILPLQITIKKC